MCSEELRLRNTLVTLVLSFAVAPIWAKAVCAASTTRFRTALLCEHTHMTIVIAGTTQQFSVFISKSYTRFGLATSTVWVLDDGTTV
ncbi:unnamed protein product [Toxocara canis]|uniref:Secreted protein n=1 Tax=Toxocara canis TaxID=6265 RepID=A0A183UDM1_TOXCA|nr:unnamed protein product [Toxocara canis]